MDHAPTDAEVGFDIGAVAFLAVDVEGGPIADCEGNGEPDDSDNCATESNE